MWKTIFYSLVSVLSLQCTASFSLLAEGKDPARKLKIIFADDQAEIRMTFGFYLENIDKNSTIIEAASGEEVLRILETESVDLVISDNSMPVEGKNWIFGYELLAKMRADERFANIPFFMHSTDKKSDDGLSLSDTVKKLGGNGMIPKPSSGPELTKLLQAVIERVRAEKPITFFTSCTEILKGLSD